MEAAVHGLPEGDFLGRRVTMDLLQTKGSVIFEALGPNLSRLDTDAPESFDGVMP